MLSPFRMVCRNFILPEICKPCLFLSTFQFAKFILPYPALRKSKSFIPELSLVAVEDEKIVGHILFTKAVVQGVEVLALAPLSVLPDYQNRGIGLSLMKEGHSIAHKLGYEYSVVLGHSKYYPKAGYIPASECGIKAPFEVDDESFMALNLNGSQNKLNGVIEYDKAFGI